MRIFTGKKTGCVLVVGWQANDIAEQLVQCANNTIPHLAVSATFDAPPKLPAIQHIQADLSQEDAVKRVFTQLAKQGHYPQLVIFQADPGTGDQPQTLSAAQIEQRWQRTGFSLFLWAQATMAALQQTGKQRQPATFVTLGSDLAIRPKASSAFDSAMYAGMRAVMQSLAREFQPEGVHVAYVGLDADNSTQAVARLCWQLHQQPLSAWTQEVVLVG